MPTIVKGSDHMQAVLYTGTGATQTISGLDFQPDLVWIKSRSAATDHKLTDAVRGVTKALVSNSTAAETTDTTGITAFTSTGFTLGANSTYNNSGATYVAWCWKAGGSTSSNTNGSITSSVSVNASAGFSVVTYTGTNVSGATIGHGLGVAPSLIIIKNRTSAEAWPVYHRSVGATKYLVLNTTAAEATSSTPWNNTAPTSTVFSLGNWNALNENGSNHVAYCWTPIAGYSAFGSYTGNSSTDGPFVYTGFRPRFIMTKPAGDVGAWVINDTARDTYNVSQNYLLANSSDAQGSLVGIDILSNGFKPRGASYNNPNGISVIYMAFAENPLKNALAR
jgi:hypothetical protein